MLGRVLTRSIENPSVPLSAANISQYLDGAPSVSGVKVTEQSAMQHVAVFRCTELIAGTCAALPFKAYRKGSRARLDDNYPVLADPHPELTSFEVFELMYVFLLLWGNAYFLKQRDGGGRIRYLWPLHPGRVRVDRVDPDAQHPGGKVFVVADRDGGTKTYTSYEVLHIPGLGYDGKVGLSRIQLASQALGMGMAAEKYAAQFFGSGQMLSGILTSEQTLTQESAETLKARWREKVVGLGRAHDIAVLDRGVTFTPLSIPAKDAQLLESQQWSVTQIARLFGLPPHAVGDVEKSTSWGSGIEQQTIGMVQFTLQPSYLTRVEKRFTKEVLTTENVYAEYAVEGLLRGDSAARAAFYAQAVQWGWMTRNEVRVRENLEPIEGLDSVLTPLNMDTGAEDELSIRELTEMVQKIYLGVGKVLSADEARDILNRAGAGLVGPFIPGAASDSDARSRVESHLRLLVNGTDKEIANHG